MVALHYTRLDCRFTANWTVIPFGVWLGAGAPAAALDWVVRTSQSLHDKWRGW